MHAVRSVPREAIEFRARLQRSKNAIGPATFWYPYDILANVAHLERLLGEKHRSVLEELRGRTIADIGAADGDVAYFFESLGNTVDIIDYGSTNYNGLRGARMLGEHLRSAVDIYDLDLDSRFTLPREKYDVAFLLGILYHLKNPFYLLEHLAERAATCFLSTRVARHAGPRRTSIDALPVAYLLAPGEANGDATNFWVFTGAGLRRLLDRCGWDVLAYTTVGNVKRSDPSTAAGDERAFCYLRSRHFSGR